MKTKDEVREVRETVAHTLRQKGYTVSDIGEGQGVPRLSRLEITKGGETLVCSVKVGSSRSGRISFARDEEGTRFSVLPAVDRVIYARPMPGNKILIMMFKQSTVLKAFEANYQVLKERGQGHLPIWVNPEPEEGWRRTGSGYKTEALWSEVVPLAGSSSPGLPLSPASPTSTTSDGATRPLTIIEAKRGLALTFNVPVEAVEITIRG